MLSYSSFKLVLYLWIGIAIFIFFILFFKTAPYGKFTRKGWGPLIPPKPAWLIMESPPLIIVTLFFILGKNLMLIHTIFLILWLLHYSYRDLVYPFLLKSKRGIPLTIILSAICFNIINSYIQGSYLFIFSSHNYNNFWLKTPQFILGTILFFLGFSIHLYSDNLLRRQKKENNSYIIPQGGLFNLISTPNYFGEIVEWIGWAILTWSLAAGSFAIWSIANLFPRSIKIHKWYKENFPNYPPNRKAIIPFII